jgi:hypothetical protein
VQPTSVHKSAVQTAIALIAVDWKLVVVDSEQPHSLHDSQASLTIVAKFGSVFDAAEDAINDVVAYVAPSVVAAVVAAAAETEEDQSEAVVAIAVQID